MEMIPIINAPCTASSTIVNHKGMWIARHIIGATQRSIVNAETYFAPYLSDRWPPSGEVTNTGITGASITRPTVWELRPYRSRRYRGRTVSYVASAKLGIARG
jgi:hypothetical protein